jgi:FMN-binding protein
MRRVILAVTGTIAGLVALLSFRSHVPSSPVAATAGGAGGGSSSSSASSSPSAGSTSPPRGGGQTEAAPGAFPQGSLAGTLSAGETAVNGKVASTAYGPVQIQLIERSGKIVKVAVLVQPINTLNDIQIGKFAFPKLISETLTTQNAKIDAVSGATYTSAGYVKSLQSALDKST